MNLSTGYTAIEELPLSDIHVKDTYLNHHRLGVFARKGSTCVSCHVNGSKLITAVDKVGGHHADVYTDTGLLMTVHYIKPLHEGGTNSWDNKEPMCNICCRVSEKDNLTLEEIRERAIEYCLKQYTLVNSIKKNNLAPSQDILIDLA